MIRAGAATAVVRAGQRPAVLGGVRSRRLRSWWVVAISSVLMVLPASPASAHATLLESYPVAGAVLAETPPEITLRYDEAVGTSLGSVKILAPDGSKVDTGAVSTSSDGATIAATLPPELPAGTYTVLWRVLSEDTHSIFGASTFSIGRPSATSASVAAAEQQGEGKTAGELLDVARLLLYLGIVALIGALGFVLVLWESGRTVPAVRRTMWTGWGLAVFGSLAALLLQGPYAAGASLGSLLDPALIADVLGTRFGVATLIRLVLLAAFAPLLRGLPRLPLRISLPAAAVLGLGTFLTISTLGHSGSGELVVLAMAADSLHLAAASCWIGGLGVLALVVLRRRPADLGAVLPRWSRYAATAVVVLVGTGTFTAWRQVRELGAVTATDYGRLLLIKIGLVVVMLGLAAAGRAWIRRHYRVAEHHAVTIASDALVFAGSQPEPGPRPATAGSTDVIIDASSVRRLRTSVLLETVLAVAVLAVTTVLVSTVPAKDTYFPEFSQTGPVSAGLQVDVTVTPARTGPNELRLAYRGTDGQPSDVVKATARWTSENGEFVVPVELVRTATGNYDVPAVTLPTTGYWKLSVTSQTSDIDSTTTLFTVRIR